MRAHRLVLLSAVLASATVSTGADARPRFPGILGAVVGTVGGLVGLGHHGWAGPRYRGYPARTVAARPSDEPRADGATAGSRTGALFWPQLYDDVFDYVFWPSGNGDRFWTYGYGDIVGGALRPGSTPMSNAASQRRGPARIAAATSGTGGASGPCVGEKNQDVADALIERIEQAIQPTDAQQPALAELRAAAQLAHDDIEAACPAAQAQTPTTRLDAMEDRLWAARQALMITRAPLDTLYASLTDEQKARLNGPVSQAAQANPGCSQSTGDLPLAQPARGAKPNAEQRAGLEALRTTSAGLAKLLAGSCPSVMPATPVERLDAADTRLNAMLYAVVTLRAPLDAFASPRDGQKAR